MDIQAQRLARRYAHAFLNVYGEQINDAMLVQFDHVSTTLAECRSQLLLFKLPTLTLEKKKTIMREIAQRYDFPDVLYPLIDLLLVDKRLTLLAGVLDALIDEYKKREQRMDFVVTSWPALSDQQQQDVHAFLTRATHKKIMCSYYEDPTLIAGMRMQSATLLWECSIQKKLDAVRLSLLT